MARQLLNGYWKNANQPFGEELDTDAARVIVRLVPRPWWMETDVRKDGYIHGNLARHLAGANLGAELGALLLDARWTEVRVKTTYQQHAMDEYGERCVF